MKKIYHTRVTSFLEGWIFHLGPIFQSNSSNLVGTCKYSKVTTATCLRSKYHCFLNMCIYQDMETLLEPHFSIQLETGTSFQFSNSKKPLEHPLVWKNAWARVRGRWEFYGCCGRRMGSQDGRKWLITVVIISPRSSVVLNQPARICSLLRWTLSNESHTFDGVIKLTGLRAWNLK